MLRGSCLCGSVRYEVAAEITQAENCHCSMCRKAHGAAFSTNALVPTEKLRVHGEEHLRAYASSQNRQRLFCMNCGSQLFIKRLNAPEGTVISLGTLDVDPHIQPSRHVFFGSKAPWFTPEASLPKYEVYPGHESDE
ncbi:MAG: GFA family protein [Burkholderiales bacterium]|nr:GFA family protein [Burkholderiales bacterium]